MWSLFLWGFVLVESYQTLKRLEPQWLPWRVTSVIRSALRLVDPVSVYCDWVRQQV